MKIIQLSLFILFGAVVCANGLPVQTDVHNAKRFFDEKGINYLVISGVGKTYNPTMVATYALCYANAESFLENPIAPDEKKFRNSIDYLVKNLKKSSAGYSVWFYDFDSTYNEVTIKAPWFSAFGQATGIDALLAGYEKFKDKKYLDAAIAAAEVFFVPLEKGGVLFNEKGLTLFEEIPLKKNPSHIFNGHLRAMLALHKLYKATGSKKYLTLFQKGSESIKKLIPLYDTGYAFRYDLNPRKQELLFRFNNPYNGLLPSIPIDSVKLVDPLTGKSHFLDIGKNGDAVSGCRIAGNDWLFIENCDGRTVRKLKPVIPVNPLHAADGGMNSPGTYFYLPLPDSWNDNLREKWFELEITYKDTVRAPLVVEMRSMAPGVAFRPLRDGDLMLTGSGEWRTWKVPVRVSDLGYWCGEDYARTHYLYLKKLAEIDPAFQVFANRANSYYRLAVPATAEKTVEIKVKEQKLPRQTTMLPVFSFDNIGVLMQTIASEKSRFNNGIWLKDSDPGTLVYSPFRVADQARSIDWSFISQDVVSKIRPEPAFMWLKNNIVLLPKNGATWHYNFDNAYNDVVTKKPWPSSFSQLYIVNALGKAIKEKRQNPVLDYLELYHKAINGFKVPLTQGGFSSYSDRGTFFEEVPNGTHVLNAHLASMAELQNHPIASDIYAEGVETLRNTLHLFDTGYWLRYDMNPKKNFLLQLDWLKGKKSPEIISFSIEDTRNGKLAKISASSLNPFERPMRFCGTDWNGAFLSLGGKYVSFTNGYKKRKGPVKGGTWHNVFIHAILPDWTFSEYFDVPVYRAVLKYRDVAPGVFALKTQSISEGNELVFVPVRNGVLHCIGDGKWKEAVFHLRPQELGWFVGPGYQDYVVKQLQTLGKRDWFFQQYYLRHQDNLKFPQKGTHLILSSVATIEKKDASRRELPVKILYDSSPELEFSVISSMPCYKNHGVDKSLDKNTDNDYTASLENQKNYEVVLQSKTEEDSFDLEMLFESPQNYSDKWTVIGINASGKTVFSKTVEKNDQSQKVQIRSPEKIQKLHLRFQSFQGQNRLLLRRISGVVKNADSSMQLLYLYASFAALQMELNNVKFYNAEKQGRITVWASESSRRKLRQLYSGNIRGETQVALTGSASSVLVEMKGFSADLSFYTSPKSYDNYKQFLKDDKVILYRPDDTANPLYLIRAPITLAHKKFADDICRKEGAKTDLEKVLAFMKYITYFDVGFPVDSKPSGTLLEKVGDCGPFTMVLNALACASGLRVKNVNLCNYPKDNGHSVSEILINGKWRIFDPTYGLYFKDSKTGELMSFEDLRNPANKAIPVYINAKRYAQSGERTGWGTQRAYLYANPAGVIGPDKPMYFPLKMNLQSLSQIFFPQNGASHQGGYYIGSGMTNNNHVWELSGLMPGKQYVLEYTFTHCGGDKRLPNFHLSCQIQNGQLQERSFILPWKKPGVLKIKFRADAPTVKLTVEHPYRGKQFVYITVKAVKLAALNKSI